MTKYVDNDTGPEREAFIRLLLADQDLVDAEFAALVEAHGIDAPGTAAPS